jgi:hypothetical protein
MTSLTDVTWLEMQTTASGSSRNMGGNRRNIRWNTAVPGGNRGNGYIIDNSKKYCPRAAPLTPDHSQLGKLHDGLSVIFLEHNPDTFAYSSVWFGGKACEVSGPAMKFLRQTINAGVFLLQI